MRKYERKPTKIVFEIGCLDKEDVKNNNMKMNTPQNGCKMLKDHTKQVYICQIRYILGIMQDLYSDNMVILPNITKTQVRILTLDVWKRSCEVLLVRERSKFITQGGFIDL